jgi:small subunit ribosomal protein S21
LWKIYKTICGLVNRKEKKLKKEVKDMVQVNVRENNVDQALRALKKKLQREGIFKEMKDRRHYKKPSIKRVEAKEEAIRRIRKLEKKRRMSE